MPMLPVAYITACACPANHQAIIYQRFRELPDGCWQWLGNLDRNGYGVLTHAKRSWLAHRLSYAAFVGPIPDGLTIDHFCRQTDCVNPAHMEPVTMSENSRRAAVSHPGASHGTATAYSNGGCRCDLCKAANRERCADYRRRRRAGFRPGEVGA